MLRIYGRSLCPWTPDLASRVRHLRLPQHADAARGQARHRARVHSGWIRAQPLAQDPERKEPWSRLHSPGRALQTKRTTTKTCENWSSAEILSGADRTFNDKHEIHQPINGSHAVRSGQLMHGLPFVSPQWHHRVPARWRRARSCQQMASHENASTTGLCD